MIEVARPRVLACAGRDPTRGAGVDADAEAIEAAGARAETVVTTDTDQDGRRVAAVRPLPEERWAPEARAVLEGSDGTPGCAAVKFGLLARAEAVVAAAAIANLARSLGLPVVVDPVLAASGGEPFLDARGIERLLDTLVPTGVVLTPNLPEAARLAGAAAEALAARPEDRVAAARTLLDRGAEAVVLKGGHGGEDPVRDLVLVRGAPPRWVTHPRVAGAGIHGSGCRHASFLAARLALGEDLEAAARAAGAFLAERIRGV